MKNKFKMLEQKQLIQKLNQLSTLPPSFSRPKEGWIRTVRKALSMTTTQLAKKLGIQQSRVSEIEKVEILNQLNLKTLMHTAEALGCRFEYAFIPEKPLDDLLKERAFALAKQKVDYISHHMMLEGQALTEEEKNTQIQELAEELLRAPRKLWEDL